MTKVERAIAALREAADAIEHVPHRTGLLGRMLPPEALRAEAEWLERWNAAFREANEPS